jgi:hypothetical protein
MFSTYLPYLSVIQSELENISTRNQEKLDEILVKYKETKSLPRKKKKKIRKELNREYSFWYSIGEWEKSMYTI